MPAATNPTKMCPVCEALGTPCTPVVQPGDRVVFAMRYGRKGKRGGFWLYLERPGEGIIVQLRPEGHP